MYLHSKAKEIVWPYFPSSVVNGDCFKLKTPKYSPAVPYLYVTQQVSQAESQLVKHKRFIKIDCSGNVSQLLSIETLY